MEIFYLTTSTPGLTQELRSCVTDLKEYNFRAERQRQKKKKLTSPNQFKLKKKIQSQAEKETQRLFTNNNGETYIRF